MLYYYRIDVSEGIDSNKTSASKECGICQQWYFPGKGFKFQLNVCNRCHDVVIVLMMSTSTSDIAIWNISGVAYCCTINGISKSKTTNLLQNADLTEKRGTL